MPVGGNAYLPFLFRPGFYHELQTVVDGCLRHFRFCVPVFLLEVCQTVKIVGQLAGYGLDVRHFVQICRQDTPVDQIVFQRGQREASAVPEAGGVA